MLNWYKTCVCATLWHNVNNVFTKIIEPIYKVDMMNELSSQEFFARTGLHSDKGRLDAQCIICNKRFKSMRGISMHLKMTGERHSVIVNNYGNYDKKTGLKEMGLPETRTGF
jgi:hypothetical protein